MCKYKLVDLFAGAGGLSLGFFQTGRFEIKAFVEKNSSAADTYRHYFPSAKYYTDVIGLDFRKMKEDCGGIDVVIGGPPCQGFSNANRQHNQAINQNNKLVKQFIRAVLEIQPAAFVMENVSMLKSDIHRFYIEKDDAETVKKYEIPSKDSSIFLLSHKYVFEGVADLVGSVEEINKNRWDEELYSLLNIWQKDLKNEKKFRAAVRRHMDKVLRLIKEYKPAANPVIADADKALFGFIQNHPDMDIDIDEAGKLLDKPISFQKMLFHAAEVHDNNITAAFSSEADAENREGNLVVKTESCAVYDYLTGILESYQNGYSINKGVLSAETFGVPQKRKRFVLIGVKKQYTDEVELPIPPRNTIKTTVYDAIKDLEYSTPYETVAEDNRGGRFIGNSPWLKKLANLRDSNGVVYNHIVPKTTGEAVERFRWIKQGQNFHDLPDDLKVNTYTNAGRTQNTIYKRLKYDEPSGTVINVRKSMWIHPVKNRAVSVREAARLQTFPDSFRFYGTKDSQYQQVGNAVPPMLAKAIAEQILRYLDAGKNDG